MSLRCELCGARTLCPGQAGAASPWVGERHELALLLLYFGAVRDHASRRAQVAHPPGPLVHSTCTNLIRALPGGRPLTDLSVHTAEHLDRVAAELNDRPRRLAFRKPIGKMESLLLR